MTNTTLVAGKTAGTMAVKALCIVGGTMCFCSGVTLMLMRKKDTSDDTTINSEENFDAPKVPVSEESDDVQPE